MTTTANQPQLAAVETKKERSLFQQSMRRLFKNKGAVAGLLFIIVLVLVCGPFAGLVSPADPIRQDLLANNAVPQWMLFILPEGAENYARIDNSFPFSADSLGRDIMSRTIYGGRISLAVAFVAATISIVIGTLYGAISGYFGGKVDNVMMRVIDFLYGFPFLIVVILLQAYFKAMARQSNQGGFAGAMVAVNESMGGLFFLFIAIGLIGWIGIARVARGQVLSFKAKEFVEAARAMGASDTRIIFKHLIPNIIGPIIVIETLAIPGYIFTEAFLSFIGLGVDPPTPSWGIMISEGVQALRSYPNQVLVPAAFLTMTTLAFTFLGDGLRDAFDPKQAK